MTGAVWPDLLSPAEMAALHPGVPTPWPATPDVLVVGGGVVGLAVAAACRRAGVELLPADTAVAVEPALGDPVAALLVHDQAHVNPLRVAAALARRAGTVATGVTMTAVEANGSRTRVRTSAGDVSPGAVVFATG